MIVLILWKKSMTSDYRTERVEPSLRVQGYTKQGNDGGRRHPFPHAYEQPPRPTPHPSADDVASVLGLPADQVTPAVMGALVPLLAEIDRLHFHSEQTERRLAWLEHQADRHSVVPCLTRRALVRELASLMSGGDAHGAVAVLQVAGVEALRQIHGLVAGEGALRHIAANIIGALRNTDVVGCLGGSDFAILMPGTDLDHARAKMDEICARLMNPPFTWLGQRIPLTPAFGLYTLREGDGAEQALATADRARRGLE
ncbi:MAG: diguanylate cyclase [Rhodospirillaceae bacterium]|nr:diguanylate cyclase [Rhodospirillales bacterium]